MLREVNKHELYDLQKELLLCRAEPVKGELDLAERHEMMSWWMSLWLWETGNYLYQEDA